MNIYKSWKQLDILVSQNIISYMRDNMYVCICAYKACLYMCIHVCMFMCIYSHDKEWQEMIKILSNLSVLIS